jgi:DNA-directed RNA polymerase subunit beta'
MRVEDIIAIKIKLASPEDILKWSYGEVLEPETINYRNQKPEKDGLFCEKIFGPEKDYKCYCGKYRKVRFKGTICDRCGVEVTKASVRRERMGHIKLACPIAHIWFLRGIPSRMGLILDIPMKRLEEVVYFSSYIITKVDEESKKRAVKEINKEHKKKTKEINEEFKGEALEEELNKLKEQYDKVKEELKSIKLLNTHSEADYHHLSMKYGEMFEAKSGAGALREIFEKIDVDKTIEELKKEKEKTASAGRRKKAIQRLKVFIRMKKAGIKPEWMFVTILPVLPPELRPIIQLDGGRYASSDLNDLYRRVINRNNRLKYLLEIDAPEVIVRNEKRMLQEAVDALLDNQMRKGVVTQASTGGTRLLKSLADMLKGKQGRFRQNLLGKRVDYSGRSVIVVGPNLELDQCGVPKQMALEIFKPFVISKILEQKLAYNVRGAGRLIEEGTDEVWAILEEVVKGKTVLLNRAPTLHRLGIQAFRPVLVEGYALRIHPFVCEAFNADFDGDQMAIHLPLSERAQEETKKLMLSSKNLLKPATGRPVVSPSQDIVLGCYFLTMEEDGVKGEGSYFSSIFEVESALEFEKIDLHAKIKMRIDGKVIETTAGRVIFNKELPEGVSYQNKTMKSRDLKGLVEMIIREYKDQSPHKLLDKIKDLGFEYATTSGISWGMSDIVVPKEKKGILEKAQQEKEQVEKYFNKGLFSEEERKEKVIEIWSKAKKEVEEKIPGALPIGGSVFIILDSGARGSWSQPIQMSGMKGLVVNPSGDIIELPIKSSYHEGFNPLEYFISTHGARKGTADTALCTAQAGYLTRRLIDVAHEVIVTEDDCKDTEGIEVLREDADEIYQNLFFKISGRIVLEDVKVKGKVVVKKGEVIDAEKAKIIDEAKIPSIKIRSPLRCKTVQGICSKCYGWDMGSNEVAEKGFAAGIIAAQAIGEPGTQLTMRTFHTGGVAGGADITLGLPRVQEIFERRVPKGKAEISDVDGKVVDITENRVIKIKPSDKKTKKKTINYQIEPKKAIYVNVGDTVKKGDSLCEGNVDINKLFKLRKGEYAQKYILKELQKAYVSQGVDIHDKHLEVIVKQMLSRVSITEPGDSSFTLKETVERRAFLAVEKEIKKKKGVPPKAEEVLLGISKVALTTDSFFSAASFQQTSKVLIDACLEGKVDNLTGMKENVIIGKLIPSGSAFKQSKK